MDFFKIKQHVSKKRIVLTPSFIVGNSKDLMIRGKSFYAVWNPETGLWSRNESDVARLGDQELWQIADQLKLDGNEVLVKTFSDFSTGVWTDYRNYVSKSFDNYKDLDTSITFKSEVTTRIRYASKRLPYDLEDEPCEAWDELLEVLYDNSERRKIEWAIGAVLAGDGKDIQKFFVFYGEPGSGKSTIMNIIQKLFEGYCITFEAKALANGSDIFSMENFQSNPLVAIQHDGDLSKILDNTKLNSIVSHESMLMREKYKAGYDFRPNCLLFMGTNKPVKITDAKSGLIRRLVDIRPTGSKIPANRYEALVGQVNFELGAIAKKCLDVYNNFGIHYYDSYRSTDMMAKTNVFYNFMEENYFTFKEEDGCSLKRGYSLYKDYCNETLVDFKIPMYRFRDEFQNYFREFKKITRIDNRQVRSYYSGFRYEVFTGLEEELGEKEGDQPEDSWSLVLDSTESLLDQELSNYPAQYAGKDEVPNYKWVNVKTKLRDLDTSKIHYVKVPENHIVIDFDLKNETGKKSAELNLKEASKWPPTYAEFSKGGQGLHLHYIYDGDPKELSRIYSENIEIKVFTGDSSLRRRLTKCNTTPIATIKSGLPLKGAKMVNFDSVKSEKALRTLILRNLNKEIHSSTKPSVDFIFKILEDAYSSGLHYDVTDMRPKILAFANNSTHQAEYCVKLVSKMKFKSEETSAPGNYDGKDDRMVFFDCEVFPNLFLVNWKYQGKENQCVHMINPTPAEMESFMRMKLVGFNCRRYDNHIIYARYLGYSNEELYQLSQKLIGNKSSNCTFGEAYNLSYTDVYDFASAGHKQSLKKFEIELGIHHQELGLPWDEPVPEDRWTEVSEYCDNDVISTEAVFDYLAGDWAARQILAKLSGLTVNDTTNAHSTKIIFGGNKKPQSQFNYWDLSKQVDKIDTETMAYLEDYTTLPMKFVSYNGGKSILPYFPGYKFENGVSTYRDEEVGEGGYVYAEPGMHWNVALLDIASMHPSSIEDMCVFGPVYTKRFTDIKQARLRFKHKDRTGIETFLDGRLTEFFDAAERGEYSFKDISNALKTVINSVYGLTSAKFSNEFKDDRNDDNIVAKRGALFMIDLKHAVQERGFTVAHIKTDSIKIPNATPEIIQFVMDFGKQYGYTFEHEATYDRMCLVNDAVYIAKYAGDDGEWTATGTQFQQPYVFKTLFSKEPIKFEDMCEAKSVTSTAMYLDMNEKLGEEEHDYVFIGRVGAFCPIKPYCGGGLLVRKKDEKYDAVTGTKGYRWLESELVRELGKENDIDESYYRAQVDKAVATISKYGDFEMFRNEPYRPLVNLENPIPPFEAPEKPWSDELLECSDMLEPGCGNCKKWDSCSLACKLPF